MDQAELFVKKIRLQMKRSAESDKSLSRSVMHGKRARRAKLIEEELDEVNRLAGALPRRFAGYLENRRVKMDDLTIYDIDE